MRKKVKEKLRDFRAWVSDIELDVKTLLLEQRDRSKRIEERLSSLELEVGHGSEAGGLTTGSLRERVRSLAARVAQMDEEYTSRIAAVADGLVTLEQRGNALQYALDEQLSARGIPLYPRMRGGRSDGIAYTTVRPVFTFEAPKHRESRNGIPSDLSERLQALEAWAEMIGRELSRNGLLWRPPIDDTGELVRAAHIVDCPRCAERAKELAT